jgi:hypothetical protein
VSDDDESVRNVGRYEWERIVRRCVLPKHVKTTAAYLAQYADRDGSRVYPGVARLSAVSSMSERSTRDALGILRELDLITRTRKGSSLGRQAMTDEHKLTRPVDLERRIHMLDPDESPASAACDSTCVHDGTPARVAGDKAPRKPSVAAEHRQTTTGTPANRAGTPANDDRNTGTGCTPPPDDHPQDHPNNQRGNQDPNLSTEGQSIDLDELHARLIQFDELVARRAASQ